MQVFYDQLEYSNDHIYLFNGLRFTGTAVEFYANGTLLSELHFEAGLQHGITREYHPAGTNKLEVPYVHGLRHGIEREWHDDGTVYREMEFAYDVLMNSRTLTRDGTLLEEFHRGPNDALTTLVGEKKRRDVSG
ncbi:hypothetical protein PLANPX_2503 [Lacipirellula parvula]|uniref:Phophatidylinositol-4-phosphate 5-kinase n=2 Tax=Lacipirellula parvula TaxID=2650471 RepID=A0A5K7XDI0_9BACT|nr:hypothetical protein PLANPX_2503 [Lacipirellula parvula]